MPDSVGFTDFVRTYTSMLLTAAYLMTGSGPAAEDLVQDTLLSLYGKWQRVAEADVPIAYVRRCLINNFVNSRRGRRGQELLLNELPETGYEPGIATGVADRDLVVRLLAELSPRSRAIVVMRFYYDLSDAAIADEVGCRPGTVRSTLSRSLAILRELMNDPPNRHGRSATVEKRAG
jgi:RNA polymerase sigma-70 factor (sigma-E family)